MFVIKGFAYVVEYLFALNESFPFYMLICSDNEIALKINGWAIGTLYSIPNTRKVFKMVALPRSLMSSLQWLPDVHFDYQYIVHTLLTEERLW